MVQTSSVARRPSSQFPRSTSDVHIVRGRVQHPVVTLSRVVVQSRNLHEAFVETKVVTYGVLPALFVILVVRKVFHDEFVDAAERQTSLSTAPDRHHDQRVVAV